MVGWHSSWTGLFVLIRLRPLARGTGEAAGGRNALREQPDYEWHILYCIDVWISQHKLDYQVGTLVIYQLSREKNEIMHMSQSIHTSQE